MEGSRFGESDFMACCGSTRFAKEMVMASPFSSFEEALAAAKDIWFNKVDVYGWLEAFAAHPEIGESPSVDHQNDTSAQWSKGEQSTALATASDSSLQELSEWNARYRQKFGFVFLICASGRTTSEILSELKKRYLNRPIVEFEIAAQEQMNVTEIRLSKLFSTKAKAPLTSAQYAEAIAMKALGFRETSSSAFSSRGNADAIEQEDNKPLWNYVTKVGKNEGGGNVSFQCNFCYRTFKGSYSRVKAHLLKLPGCGIRSCSKVTYQHRNEMQRLVDQAELRVRNARPKCVSLLTSSSQIRTSTGATLGIGMHGIGSFRQEAFETKKRKATGNMTVEKASGAQLQEQLHAEIARMFYSAGLPFHLARNPYYVSSYSFAANNMIVGYLPPSYNLLRTTLLQKERANIERLLEPIKGTWDEKGVTIVSDGWTDAQRSLINFMAVSESGPMFLKAVNCDGECKDLFFISNLIKEAIAEVGPQNVVQVITDNAPMCKAAGLLIENQYPNIFWTPCVVHTLNLALRNICAAKNIDTNEITFDQCNWIKNIVGDVMAIKNFIMNHSMRLAIFNEFVNLKMLAIVDTRFASEIVLLRRFKMIKHGLQAMVISDEWSYYKEDDKEKALFVREKMLDDIWWDKIDYIISFTEPIYDMLKMANTDKPSLHLVCEMWDSMIEKVKKAIYRYEGKQDNEESTFYSVVHQILADRWSKSNTPLHCLAHSLNPRYYSSSWLNEAPNRVPPHKDMEISAGRTKCFKRYFENMEERRMVNVEYAKFSGVMGEFSDHDSINDREAMDPRIWWVVHGASAPMLQVIALKLLGQPCSASCCERNWSTYSFVHSLKRNKMTPQRAEDLVFVHTNLRLLSRRSSQYMLGESKMWDIGGDAFDSFDDVGILGIADLSLDEPDLEAVIFTDEGNDIDDESVEVASN